MNRVAILGGSGVVGRAVAKLLLARDDTSVVLLGRTEAKLQQTADTLGVGRAVVRPVDATDQPTLTAALADADLLIVAAPLLGHLDRLLQSALDSSTDWLDVLLDVGSKEKAVADFAGRFERAGLRLITGAGVHPGLPGAMARAVAAEFSRVESVRAGLLMSVDWGRYDFTDDTAREFSAELLNFAAAGWVGGRYRSFSWVDPRVYRRVDFGPPFGARGCALMELREIRLLPDQFPGLAEAWLAAAGFAPVVDWLVMPAALAMAKLSKRLAAPASRWLFRSLRRHAKPPFGIVVTMDVAGAGHEPIRLRVSHPDGYLLTAAAVAATAAQQLDGVIARPGARHAALAVDPHRLLADLGGLGGLGAVVERAAARRG